MKVCARTQVAAIAALGAVVPLLSSLPAAAADRPLLGQFLAVPAGNTSNAYDVSEEGTVAGSVTADDGAPQPALWRGQRLTRLPLPDGTAPPPALGYAAKVEGGVAVGSAGSGQFPGFMPVALTWRRGTPRIFTASGATASSTDLNRAGDALVSAGGPFTSSSQVERADGTVFQPGIAAYALDGRGRAVGARVTPNGTNTVEDAARSDGTTVTILDAPAGKSSRAYDAAEDGTACGASFRLVVREIPRPHLAPVEQQPLLWRPDGTRVDLPKLGTESWCTQTAGGDVAAGQYVRADGTQGAVLWIRGRAYPVGPGAGSAVAVNARGQVVGNSDPAGARFGFVADTRGWRRLTAPGGQQTEAMDLNTAGVVVGNAYTLTSEGQRTGQRAMRWRAVPTPPT